MSITKIETNIKNNLFLKNSTVFFSSEKKINNDIENINDNLNNLITINPKKTFQTFLGFGGAITESTGYSLSSLPKEKYNDIINLYFSKDELNYRFARLPIGSCDFSLKSYSYSYKKDLSDFTIKKDLNYIIPVIKTAKGVNPNIKFVATPWSPPAFMKSNKKLSRGGKLLDEYKSIWTDYLIKYTNSYKAHGINIDYMTIQNEPDAIQSWESCSYSAYEEADLLINYLYPSFKKNNLDTKFLIWDHNKDIIDKRAYDTLIKYNALNYATGIAFHWYTGSYFDNLQKVNELFPNKLLFHTEGCTGYSKFKPKDELFNAELYASEIIGDLNSGTNAFIDWNLVLDYKGGPNHKRNYCNSPIMINKKKDNYIKTPAFYYIAQFSKYIMPNSKRIEIKTCKDIIATAFLNNNNSITIVLFNNNDFNIEFNLEFNNELIHDNIDSHSIITFLITL